MKYWPLVRSALLRKPAEAILVLVSVTFGFSLFTFMLGLNATANQVVEAARDDRLFVNSSYDTPLGLPIALEQQIGNFAGVAGVGAFRWVFGYYQIPKNRAGIYAVDEGMRLAMAEYPISPAQWNELFSSGSGVLMTKSAAARWGVHKGDVFPISVKAGTREDGALSWSFQVLDIIPDTPEWASGVIIGNYKYTENARPAEKRGFVEGFKVAIADRRRGGEISSQIDHRFANSGTPTMSVPARANAEAQVRSGVAIASLTWGVGAAGLFMIMFLAGNSIAQSVKRRIPEFATLKAIGYRDVDLVTLVLVEAFIACSVGAALGTVLAAMLASVPKQHLPAGLMNIPEATISIETLTWALGLALLISIVGAVTPIVWLRRLDVATAIGGRTR